MQILQLFILLAPALLHLRLSHFSRLTHWGVDPSNINLPNVRNIMITMSTSQYLHSIAKKIAAISVERRRLWRPMDYASLKVRNIYLFIIIVR